jgi:hypothetical protein
MALYLISYDIASYDKDEYPELWAKLRELGAVKILYSEWVLTDEDGQATTIYNEIAPCIKLNDKLLVQEMARDAHWDKLKISDDAFQKLLAYARG